MWPAWLIVSCLLAAATAATADDDADRAVERWIAARARASARSHLKYRAEPPQLYANAVDTPDDLSGPATSAVVFERQEGAGVCRQVVRELVIGGAPERTVTREALLGEDCCTSGCAPVRPAGWMARLLFACHDQRTATLNSLIDPKRGVLLLEEVRGGGEVTHGRTRLKRPAGAELCQLSVAKFECDAEFAADGRGECRTQHVGERYRFQWRRAAAAAPRGVFLDRVEGELDN